MMLQEQLISKEEQISDEQFQKYFSIQFTLSGIVLKGPIKQGKKQGDYYYLLPEGSMEYAGIYEQNCKQGLWKEFICSQFKFIYRWDSGWFAQTKIFNLYEYNNGKRLRSINSSLGSFNQIEMKTGEWSEKCGLSDQCSIIGKYVDGIRQGEWKILYNGLKIGGGRFDEKGFRIGNWIEIPEQYDALCKVTFSGEYRNDKKVGQWKTYYQDMPIGGGKYDEQGLKSGIWINLHENFSDHQQVTFSGEYKNGQQVGHWNTYFQNNLIGGGKYHQGIKSDDWIVLHDNSQIHHQVTSSGEYRNGLQVGKWNTHYKNDYIGGGKYDDQGRKQGAWIELHDSFLNSCYHSHSLVTFSGDYINGLRIGQWNICQNNNQIGGGKYDEKGVKSGSWIDLQENFSFHCQVTFSGEYRNGLRIGKWNIFYNNNQIGGGTYHDNGVKSGHWTDIHDNFQQYCQVTYSGEYQNGVRIGIWNTFYSNTPIGGGKYDEKGVKSGNWTDLHENYFQYRQIKFFGEYRNGLRIGQWNISYNSNQIGGGKYSEKGVKLGCWIDLHNNFWEYCQITFSGEYRNGQRIGQWNTYDKGDQIGGGQYDYQGVKQGNWTDTHYPFYNGCRVTYQGLYKDGLRIDHWNICDKEIHIGGGKYEDSGVKTGHWTDLCYPFGNNFSTTSAGEYKNGLRIGQWKTCEHNNQIGGGKYDEKGLKTGNWIDLHTNCYVKLQGKYRNGLQIGQWNICYKNKQIGGGKYDEKGMKSGYWTDLDDNFGCDCHVTFSGEYRNGVRIGQWKRIDLKEEDQCD